MKVERFVALLEDYSGGQYTTAQRNAVLRWAEQRSPKTRGLVYRYCELRHETRYRTPPGIKDLNGWLTEIYDAYPELQAGSYNQQLESDKRLIEAEGWREEDLQENHRKLRELLEWMAEGIVDRGE